MNLKSRFGDGVRSSSSSWFSFSLFRSLYLTSSPLPYRSLSLSSWIWNPISRSRPFFIFSNLPSHSLPFYLFSFLFTLSLTFTSNCRPTYFWKFFLLSSFCNNNQILKKIIKLTLISYFVQNSQVTLDHFVQKLHIILLT